MISLIATVLNEGDNIHQVMHTLAAQTRQPDDIVIVDGGSTDDTVAIIESYADVLPLRVIVEEGANISRGRNLAIQHARGDIIAVTDAGVRLEHDWLERITQPLLDDTRLSVVAGFFVADPHNAFEIAMSAATLPHQNEIKPETFLPSSRSIAFRKQAAEQVGGYPEWLDYCEDLIFDLRLKATQPPFAFVPDARVHFRPRPTLRAFYKQYYRYARGDGKAALWTKRHLIRYATYLLVVPGIFALGALVHPLLWGLYLLGGAAYLRQPYQRVPSLLQRLEKPTLRDWLVVWALLPVIRVVGDVAKMHGYPAGLLWRARHQPPRWRIASAE